MKSHPLALQQCLTHCFVVLKFRVVSDGYREEGVKMHENLIGVGFVI